MHNEFSFSTLTGNTLVTCLNSPNTHTYDTNSENIEQKTYIKGLGTGPLYITLTQCLKSDGILKGSGLFTAQKVAFSIFQATEKFPVHAFIMSYTHPPNSSVDTAS